MDMGTKNERVPPYVGELNVSPWDAILTEVRQSAYRSAWVDERVEQEIAAERELLATEQGWESAKEFEYAKNARARELRAWLDQSRLERGHKASVARAAVAAGLSERYIESVQAEGRMIASVLQRALQAADLGPEQWLAATDELRAALGEVGRELNTRHASAGPYVRERPALEG